MKTASSHPDTDNPHGAIPFTTDKATTQPNKKGVPGKSEPHSPSPVEDARDGTERKDAEEALKVSEERYRTLVEKVPAVIYINPPDGSYLTLYISPQIEAMLGYTTREWMATDLWVERIHPDDVLWVLAATERSRESGEPLAEEYRLLAKDGSVVWVRDEAALLRDEAGEPLSWQGVMVNISERKRAEEALRESDRRTKDILESITDYFVAVDCEWRYTYINERGVRQLQEGKGEELSREDFLGKNMWEMYPETVGSVFYQKYHEALREQKTVHFEAYSSLRDRWVEQHVYPSEDGLSIYFQDITERKALEEKLRESEERFRTAFEDAPVGVAFVELDGRRFRANRALCEMLGCSEEDLLGDYLEHVHPDDRQISTEHFRRTLEEEAGNYELERRYLHADGHVVWNLTSVSLIQDSKGNPSHFVCLHQDITERKQIEQEIEELSQRNELILDAAGEGILGFDIEGRITFVNPAGASILGWEAEELIGRRGHPTMHHTKPDGTPYPREECPIHISIRDGIRRGVTDEVFWRKDGTSFFTEYTSTPIVRDEEILGSVITFSDITKRKQAEERLRQSEERYRAVVEEQTELICRFLPDKTLTFANDAYCRYFRREHEELIGMNFMQLIPEEDHAAYEEHLSRLSQENPRRTVEHRVFTPEGEVRWQEWTDGATFDEEGRLVEYQSVGRDITERKVLEERLHYQATHDLLTDLPNRHLFTDRLKRALWLTRRTRGRKVAVLYLDLDNFKVVNDSLGHEAGDLLLVMVGERLRWCLRPEDTLARFGGDEFAILLEEVEAPSDAAKVTERILEHFREPLVLEGREFVIKASIGIALGEARQNTAEGLLRDADTAMYRAKGRDEHYRVFDPAMYEQALRRLRLEEDLRRAIEDEEFVVCYQPIVDLRSGEALGVEALVRWEHPEQQGLISPSQFVPVAEEAGLVVPMGRWVLEEACRQGAQWHQEYPHLPPLVMAVNLSAKQLQHPDVAETIEETLKETGFDAHYLSLDITETLYIEALEGHTAVLDKLKRLGVRISIDDFGTGYSSLAYLKRLPADALKIDKSFIKGIGEDLEDTAIVQMVIELAHTLGMKVIAEGVESEMQAEQLKEMGCDWGQGFYFSEPLPPEAASEFLAR
jgi:diguanylate cyclase (GGDEF)-like protein/PAS domain S-box-containing protein